jgi:Rieske Fe-S protein
MPGEDQERFEDYLELERFIEELQAGRTAHPPQELTPTQARVYRMATLFHAATPGVSEPDPQFAARLQVRLEEELLHEGNERRPSLPPLARRTRRVSRRLLLTSSVAAASVAIGIGVDRAIEQEEEPGGEQSASRMVVVKIAQPTEWFTVTTTARLGKQAVKFRVEMPNGAPLLTGYLLRSDGSNGQVSEKGQLIAVSATCTHKGCIVNWSNADRRFHCPCHGGVFTQDGGIDTGTSALTYLESLPTLEVKVVQNEIRVRMPLSD